MALAKCVPIADVDLARFDDVYARYRLLHEKPQACRPMIIINVPVEKLPTWEERLADPLVMLEAELALLQPHLAIEDDRVPTVRVQFGTAQVAAAFGCSIYQPENNLPCAGDHVLKHAQDVHQLELPAVDAGEYGKLIEWTKIWQEILPAGIHIQLPDLQSAFNSAHLIRGNDILLDLLDDPDAVEVLLDRVTDFMIASTRHLKAVLADDPDWFFDWGALWKGGARISNCSMQMISPQLYRDYVFPRDIRFMDSIGGGRMHYCGITAQVIDDFVSIPQLTGMDIDCNQHDFFALCERMPERVTFMAGAGSENLNLNRLLRGDWPPKRNLVIVAAAASVAEGKILLKKLRKAIPY